VTRRRHLAFAILLLMFGQSVAPHALARDDDRGKDRGSERGRDDDRGQQRGNDRGQTSSDNGRGSAGISSGQAASIARGAYGGRVVSVQSGGDGGYKVRLLLDGGRVKTVRVDGRGSVRGSD
jgi:uncharacterized membrane protein YkoI